jgi:hypothetical protein
MALARLKLMMFSELAILAVVVNGHGLTGLGRNCSLISQLEENSREFAATSLCAP